MKQKWIDAFMDTAERFAQLSSATRLKVGAVVVKDNRIISIGYNGTPAGWDNECENEEIIWDNDALLMGVIDRRELKTKPEVIHAEANAITKLARDGESGSGSSIFCTHAPCLDCAKLIYGSGITNVFYRESYRNTDGINFLKKCNISVSEQKVT